MAYQDFVMILMIVAIIVMFFAATAGVAITEASRNQDRNLMALLLGICIFGLIMVAIVVFSKPFF